MLNDNMAVTSLMAKKLEALDHLALAILALDASDAPHNIGALVDHALDLLSKHLGQSDVPSDL